MPMRFLKMGVMLLAVSLVLLVGCSQPQPVIVVITAVPPPTLTPLPALPTATQIPLPPPTFPSANASVSSAANTPISLQSSSSQQPPPPPPPQPTATPVLVQLGVFDQGGGQMELTMFGPSVANKFLAYRAIVCNPDCKNNRPDGRDVDTVKFTFYKWSTQGGGQRGAKVFEQTESAAPYCSFGGSNTCEFLNLTDRNVKWPGTNIVIDNGEYYFEVLARGKNNRTWDGNFRFRVQR